MDDLQMKKLGSILWEKFGSADDQRLFLLIFQAGEMASRAGLDLALSPLRDAFYEHAYIIVGFNSPADRRPFDETGFLATLKEAKEIAVRLNRTEVAGLIDKARDGMDTELTFSGEAGHMTRHVAVHRPPRHHGTQGSPRLF